jgi:two-component system, OmpR family, sensor kinase
MTRHFLGLYLLIVLTLAAVSWGQDRLLQSYGTQEAAEDKSLVLAMTIVENQLRGVSTDEWKSVVAAAAAKTGVDMELFSTADITGPKTLDELGHGKIANRRASGGASWALKQLDAAHVLAIEYIEPETQRGLLEWALTLLFYAVIALVIMIWIWPLTRDLRVLEKAAAQFGNRNWHFDGDIKPHSQIYPLATTFRAMAARIDGLIASHKDMSNAVSHEIKTPLARMQFEIELAQQTDSQADVRNALRHIKDDITAINDLVTATLDYAILERAEMTLNIGAHNFTTLIPAIVDAVRRDTPPEIRMACDVQSDADKVNCDVHLIEAVLKNLLYNASRYARRSIDVTFSAREGLNQLLVDDDGPGIPEQDRKRAFESFVQLDGTRNKKTGFGLGLAIVKRAIEWHGGAVSISESPQGGARFSATWPVNIATAPGMHGRDHGGLRDAPRAS